MGSDTDVIYELLKQDLSLRRAVADFDRDWREHWPSKRQATDACRGVDITR